MKPARTLASCLFALVILLTSAPALPDSQGARAAASGRAFEDEIALLLEERGYQLQTHAGYGGTADEDTLRGSAPRLALRQPPYTTLYGSPGRADFLLIGPQRKDDVWIETKRMSVPGSLDEKIPHMFLSALTALPGHHVIILIDGEGWRPGALTWLKAQTRDRRWNGFANYPGKRIDVMTLEDFTAWINQEPGLPVLPMQNRKQQ